MNDVDGRVSRQKRQADRKRQQSWDFLSTADQAGIVRWTPGTDHLAQSARDRGWLEKLTPQSYRVTPEGAKYLPQFHPFRSPAR